jgi:hypothetical protein
MHVFEVMLGFGYFLTIWWVLSNMVDDKEEQAPRAFRADDKQP